MMGAEADVLTVYDGSWAAVLTIDEGTLALTAGLTVDGESWEHAVLTVDEWSWEPALLTVNGETRGQLCLQ